MADLHSHHRANLLAPLESVAFSALFHGALLVWLAWWALEPPRTAVSIPLLASQATTRDATIEPVPSWHTPPEEAQVDLLPESLSDVAANMDRAALDSAALDDSAVAPAGVDLAEIGLESLADPSLLGETGLASGFGVEGRGDAARGALLAKHGGTAESESAVALGLKWLSAHQREDGSWNFDHREGRCLGRCGQPGTMAVCTTGATGLALLPFLGAGETHRAGDHREAIRAGLEYLLAVMQVDRKGKVGRLVQGAPFYDQALAALALCEAYAMTHDAWLAEPAQRAVNFIVAVQDPSSGGWRYQPRMPGDTSVVGWQLMALKSAQLGYLKVPPATIDGATRFLDSVQSPDGSFYGYTRPQFPPRPGTTAVGLLCRLYTGWKSDAPGLRAGTQWLAEHGPSRSNMYFNYYATQVMLLSESPLWPRWNETLREYLIRSQSRTGHEEGSWYFDGSGDAEPDHGELAGGRLYFTALAAMTLEVYYRYQPLYQGRATEDF